MYGFTGAYSAFRPVYCLSKALGTMPLKMTLSTRPNLIKDRRCLLFSISCLVVSAIHGLLTPYFVAGDSKTASTLATNVEPIDPVSNSTEAGSNSHKHRPSYRMSAMKALNPLAVSFMSLGALFVGCVFVYRGLPCFLNELYQVDICLTTVIKSCTRLDLRVSVMLFIYFWVITTPITGYYLCSSFVAVAGWEFSWNLILGLGNLISLTTELQFINLAFFLHTRFKSINKFLKSHIVSNKSSYFSICKMVMLEKSALTLRQVEILHKSNMKLCDLMKDLNYIYQIQLLCSTAGSFIKIIFNVYFAITAPFNFSHSSKIFLWSIYYVIRFFVTVIAASYTSLEALKTKSLVAHVNSRHRPQDIKEELDLFLDHASTWTMKFSACGLFTVNTKLITSALAAGTTYMVVLVQFRPSIQ